MASKLPNIDNLSLSDLNELIARAQKAIASKKDEARSGFLAKMRADATAHGLDFDEIMGRNSGGRRQYSDDDLAMLDFLRCLRDTGMPIERLRRYGELARSDQTMFERLALIEEHTKVVESRIAELESQRTRLQEKATWYRTQLAD